MAVAASFGPVSCMDDEGPEPFTTANTCFRGQTKTCDCDGEATGTRPCKADGTFGECKCPGCTVWPDCDKCGEDACFESCMCQTGRTLPESVCRSTCEEDDGGADDASADEGGGPEPEAGGGGGGGGGPTGSCDPATCPPNVLMAVPCCDGDACGADFGGTCIAFNQPGVLDPACPDQNFMNFPLPGCCRPDGVCGALTPDLVGFGCLDADALLMTGNQTRCGDVM